MLLSTTLTKCVGESGFLVRVIKTGYTPLYAWAYYKAYYF